MEGSGRGRRATGSAGNARDRRYAYMQTSGAKGLAARPEYSDNLSVFDDDVLGDGRILRSIRHGAAAGACRAAAKADPARAAHWEKHARAQSLAAMALLNH